MNRRKKEGCKVRQQETDRVRREGGTGEECKDERGGIRVSAAHSTL